ncbi:TPA: NUMOD4 domain-containing protein [Salmonella enterica subsp. enterica serovar Thompson]
MLLSEMKTYRSKKWLAAVGQIEYWKDIPGYEGSYQASNFGNVRSLDRVDCRGQSRKGRKLKAYRDGNKGYVAVSLLKGGVSTRVKVHRLIASVFIRLPMEGEQVNHINGIRDDNRVDNIEWVTCQQNIRHSFDVLNKKSSGGHKNKTGAKHHCSKAVIATRLSDGEILLFGSTAEAARALDIPSGSIPRCCNGIYRNSHGYSFVYGEHDA